MRIRWLIAICGIQLTAGSVFSAPLECKDETSCQARMGSLTTRLDELRDEMRGRQLTLKALEEIRGGILSGRRIEIPSAQRQHLEKGSPMISEVTFDARHRPISTNVSRHFQNPVLLAENKQVRLHDFLPLKRPLQGAGKNVISALLVVIDSKSQLSVYSPEGGEALLNDYDLGHGPGREVVLMELSPTQENHFIATVDDKGEIRVHNLKIVAKKEQSNPKQKEETSHAKENGKQLFVSANFSTAFTLVESAIAEARRINAIVAVERGTYTFFAVGDSLGGVSVFYRNGTLKGRVRVTEDSGGVKGLLRAQAQSILFYSSHAFGFFSTSTVDLQSPPCTGWHSPLFDVALDFAHASGRVYLALADGDVLVFATTRGKAKACDLTHKFPHVSVLPFKLNWFRGHMMGLPTPLPDTPRKDDYLREIFFFNMAAMENGYGSTPSRAVTLQASFKPKQPQAVSLSGNPTATSGGAGSKSQIAIRFGGQTGLEVYDLTIRTPTPVKSTSSIAAVDSGESSESWDFLSWFPKLGIFGMALVGVIIWNVRKVTSKVNAASNDRGSSGIGVDDFDEDLFKETLQKRRLQRERENRHGAGQDDEDDDDEED